MNLDDYEYNIETDYKSVRNHTVMRWTTTPPTKEGWYWGYGEWMGEIRVVRVVKVMSGLEVYGEEWNESLDVVTYWLGPLPVPEPPRE